jgi:hypothetical protein
MNLILNQSSILELIKLLEKRRDIELISLKNQWHESFRLGNILQTSLYPKGDNIPSSSNVVKNAIGVTTGFLINKIYPKKPNGLLAKISKLSFEIIARRLVANNSDRILTVAMKIVKSFMVKKINYY